MVRTTLVVALTSALLAQQASATWWLPNWGSTTTQPTTTGNAYLGCFSYVPSGGPVSYVASEAACDVSPKPDSYQTESNE